MIGIEIIADLRSVAADVASQIVSRWAGEDQYGSLVTRALFVTPPDTAPSASLPGGWQISSAPVPQGFWEERLQAAGRESGTVLALTGPMLPGMEAVGVLRDLLDSDPMFGAAVPRVQCRRGCCVQTLASSISPESEWMPHAGLAALHPYTLPGDVSAPVVMLDTMVLTEFAENVAVFTSLSGAIRHRLLSSRRAGFRTVVSNRAVMPLADADCGQPPPLAALLPGVDSALLRDFADDSERSWHEFRGASTALLERLTARHLLAQRGARPSLLLDMRNLGAGYNGTALAAIGAARGLLKAAIDWDVAIVATEEGAGFHDLESEFPEWTVYTSTPPSGFNVALRLSQPWHIQEMIDLHRAACLNAYLMLDTISWDVVYVAPRHLDGTWQFLASTADCLFFISEFSQQRFRQRFNRPRALDQVCHLSCAPEEYVHPEMASQPESDYLLVVGNHLEHKDVAATAELLSSAFPLTRIETLGPTRWRSATLTNHKSGQLSELDVHRLYAGARYVVFPSFYEGFGFPAVTALAYGRTLLARESPLLDEIAGICAPRGRVIAYRERDDLVDVVGRLLHGEPVANRPLGTELGGRPPRAWRDVGREIEQALRQMIMRPAAPAAWRTRDQLIAQAVAYRG